jgi:hypothetical protein
MSCNFTITFPGTSEHIVNKAKSAIEKQGGSFMGDLSSGTFQVSVLGNISGSYSISGQSMNINIDSKPIFISCSQIESFMKSHFN